jgi:hypothetical protein
MTVESRWAMTKVVRLTISCPGLLHHLFTFRIKGAGCSSSSGSGHSLTGPWLCRRAAAVRRTALRHGRRYWYHNLPVAVR